MKVIINADGKSCTTANPFDDLMPVHGPGGPSKFFLDQFQKWRELRDQAESERQTFEIDFNSLSKFINKMDSGVIWEAEIVNGKAVIK